MCPQRARGAEIRVEMQITKWTTEGMVKSESLVFHDARHALIVKDMLVSYKGVILSQSKVAPREYTRP